VGDFGKETIQVPGEVGGGGVLRQQAGEGVDVLVVVEVDGRRGDDHGGNRQADVRRNSISGGGGYREVGGLQGWFVGDGARSGSCGIQELCRCPRSAAMPQSNRIEQVIGVYAI